MTVSENLRLTEDGRIYRSGRKTYPNGDTYSGEFVDGLREGQGVLTYITGNTYHGQFKANQFHGLGCMNYGPLIENGKEICGRVYEGGWEKGLKKGEGVMHTGSGQVYEGSFDADLYHGHGALRGPGKDVLEGDWKWGRLNGEADCKYKGGLRYTGWMLNGEFHGKGKFVFGKKGGWYEGHYRLGRQDGMGTRKYSNGNLYEGSFSEGEASGEGTMRYANGDVYVGEWQGGQREGKGVLSLANGDRYEGDFLKGQIHGRGRYMWSDGGHYEASQSAKRYICTPMKGDYMATSRGIGHDVRFPLPNSLRHGRGKRVWANGATYDGRWENDRMEGDGVHVCAEGSRYEGQLRANYRHGQGRCQWGNRHDTPFRCPLGYTHAGRGYCVYEGGWKLGHWEGQGKFLCVDDRTAEGTWKKGKMDGWGTSELMLAHERGDPRRMFIGGVGGLYRVSRYSGQWSEGVRQASGLGVAEYTNKDRLIGNFVGTQLDGYGVYSFGALGKARAAFWRMGNRERWVEDKEVEANGQLAATALKTIRVTPGALVSGDLGELRELWRVASGAGEITLEALAKIRNNWVDLPMNHRLSSYQRRPAVAAAATAKQHHQHEQRLEAFEETSIEDTANSGASCSSARIGKAASVGSRSKSSGSGQR
ncbi:unnamed protein product [Ectocarpus sp. 6 AP-2014]